jgi:AmmeMemoRadiSam system protein B
MNSMLHRKPAVAGQFYPCEPEHLRESVQQYIDRSEVQAAPERVVAIVSPHAGYIYSGPTAGYAYARVRGKKPRRVILLGCSHRYHIATAAVYARGSFETPLLTFPVDEPFAEAVAEEIGLTTVEPHLFEHALEVQLPFLAEAVGEVPIVPILFGSAPNEWHAHAGKLLADMGDPDDLVIASTDLSHYHPDSRAHALDRATLDTVLTKDWTKLVRAGNKEEIGMCGAAAVVAAMSYALERGAASWSLLDYRTSAQVSGDYSRVVGYAALSMERSS